MKAMAALSSVIMSLWLSSCGSAPQSEKDSGPARPASMFGSWTIKARGCAIGDACKGALDDGSSWGKLIKSIEISQQGISITSNEQTGARYSIAGSKTDDLVVVEGSYSQEGDVIKLHDMRHTDYLQGTKSLMDNERITELSETFAHNANILLAKVKVSEDGSALWLCWNSITAVDGPTFSGNVGGSIPNDKSCELYSLYPTRIL